MKRCIIVGPINQAIGGDSTKLLMTTAGNRLHELEHRGGIAKHIGHSKSVRALDAQRQLQGCLKRVMSTFDQSCPVPGFDGTLMSGTRPTLLPIQERVCRFAVRDFVTAGFTLLRAGPLAKAYFLPEMAALCGHSVPRWLSDIGKPSH